MTWTEGDVVVDGVRLHTYRRGRGAPVVLAHGSMDSGPCWNRVAAALEGDYELVAYDARSHGRSDGSEDWGNGGDDMVAIVESLGLDRPVAMGHSMGASTATAAVASRPDLFRAAVLEDPPWRLKLPEPGEAPRVNPADWSNQDRSVEEIARAGKEGSPTWHDDEFADWAEAKLQFRPSDSWLEAIRRGGMPPWEEAVKEFACPVLLVCGTPAKMAIVTPETAADAQALYPALEVAAFDAGHNVRREAYDEVVETVRAFLHRYDP